jgi:DNA polymerase zeta
MFALRIFTINYYLDKPQVEYDPIYTDFRCTEIKQVPILRVFGSTSDGSIAKSRKK